MNPTVYLIHTPASWLKTPPLGPLYLMKYLTQRGVSCGIIDLNKELFLASGSSIAGWLTLSHSFEENLFAEAEKQYPHLLERLYRAIEPVPFIGLSLFKRNLSFTLSLAERIHERFPSKKIILGGPETMALERSGRLDQRYRWVIGEGEIPLHTMIQDDTVKIQRFREIENLDTIPFLDFDAYGCTPDTRALPLISSRGCIWGCAFCSEKNMYKKFRHHSPSYVTGQIKHLVRKHNVRTFIFSDSLINYSNEWLSEFCESLLKENLAIQWEAQMRVDAAFPPQVGRLMKKSGCYNLFVGLESACDKTLRSMQKGFTAKNALDFFITLRAAGLHFEISLIFGYPGETHHDFEETLEFIRKNKMIIPKIAQANQYVDYGNDCGAMTLTAQNAQKRIHRFCEMLEEEKIRYTQSYIGNLTYPHTKKKDAYLPP